MTEITRVPLQPIAKGALTKLWIGVIVLVALGGAVAFETRQKGLEVETVKAGTGPSPTETDVVLVSYVGRMANGKEFDRNDHAAFDLKSMIKGFTQAVEKMQKGGKYHVFIPARLGYGARGLPNPQTGEAIIPGGADLNFDIELLDFKSAAELMRQRLMMQQLQQQLRGGAGAAPGGAGAAPGGAEAAPGGADGAPPPPQ
jgi:FKBP-type peptidyl-prolyl cis-trans isomerase FkpA